MQETRHSKAFAAPLEEQEGKTNLIGMSRTEMAEQLNALGLPSFRSKQLWQWLYTKGLLSFENMTNMSKDLRAQLDEQFFISRPKILKALHSTDGTVKWLLRFHDGSEAETVFIPEKNRGTLCVSSQIGCTLTCRFCHTGTQRLVRNLSPGEIVGQYLLAKDAFAEWGMPERSITNIVMMGMGEPLYNYDAVAKALKIIMDEDGLALSKRRITLSTSGVVPFIEACGTELGVNLAVSLHAPTDDVRSEIMPINKKYPLKELMAACHAYPAASNTRRITFEYVMLKGINDSDEDALNLIQLVGDLPAKINLIPFNPWPGSDYECSSRNRIVAFSRILNNAGLSAPIRTTRGEDILAACGQLKSETERERKAAQREK